VSITQYNQTPPRVGIGGAEYLVFNLITLRTYIDAGYRLIRPVVKYKRILGFIAASSFKEPVPDIGAPVGENPHQETNLLLQGVPGNAVVWANSPLSFNMDWS
jgi:hypothetical protein